MGSDRSEHQNKSPAEVYRLMLEKYGITKRQLYHVWLGYNGRMLKGENSRTAINQLHQHPEMYPPEALNYFLVMGLELLNKEYFKELSDEV
jgi:hypothetical protein